MDRRRIAVFDFDGTLTAKDSFLQFVTFTHGLPSFILGLIRHLPILVAYKLRLCSNERAKERLFAHFYGGMDYGQFCRLGRDFAPLIDGFARPVMMEQLRRHQAQGHDVYIVSASMAEWIAPWAATHGVKRVVGTRLETDADGRLTGKFASANCYGTEKVRRFLEQEPDRESYFLYAYGDSRGDREMIAFADSGVTYSCRHPLVSPGR
ncbi:MAG: HAD-IB family hydrolase [Prevotella sp.]|nr:HAD-IB family hydrolase [Prevotella sp.]